MITIMNKEPKTTIQVSKATADKLSKRGAKGESYDVIIRKLLERKSK